MSYSCWTASRAWTTFHLCRLSRREDHLRSEFRFVAKCPDSGASTRAQREKTLKSQGCWKGRPSDQSSSRRYRTPLGRNAYAQKRGKDRADISKFLPTLHNRHARCAPGLSQILRRKRSLRDQFLILRRNPDCRWLSMPLLT